MLIYSDALTSAQLEAVGPTMQVQVGLPSAVTQAVNQPEQQPPIAKMVLALVDTGAAISGLDKTVISSLGLQPVSLAPIGSVAGSNLHAVYAIQFAIPGMLRFDPLLVIECDLSSQPQKFLLGRDILTRAMLSYIGPAGKWVLGG